MIEFIKKRDGRTIPFNENKITRAIFLAASDVAKKEGKAPDFKMAEDLTQEVIALLERRFGEEVPSVEDVQDAVVKVLIETGHAKTSEEYILYRAERTRVRNSKTRLMKAIEKITFSDAGDADIKRETGHAKTSEEYILYRAERTRVRNSKTRLMKAIEKITFSDAGDADIKRENANIDGNTAMGTMLQYGSAVSKEFCKTNVLKPEHAMAHDSGDIHIQDMDFLNMGTLTCCQIDVEKLFEGGFSTGHGFLR